MRQVHAWQAHPDVEACRDWAPLVAILMATLEATCAVLDLAIPADVRTLPQMIGQTLEVHRNEMGPHREAWDSVLAFLAQCGAATQAEGPLHYRGEFVGWADRRHYHLLTRTKELLDRVGNAGIQRHGQSWVKAGWVTPDAQGKATRSEYCQALGGQIRVLSVRRLISDADPAQ